MTDEIMKNLYKMQQNGDGTDCCFAFEVQSEDSTKEKETRLIHAHKSVLYAASPVFKTMFSEKWANNDKILIKEASFETFDAVIRGIYTGHFVLDYFEEMIKVLYIADMYQIDFVIKRATQYIIDVFYDIEKAVLPLLTHACLHKNSLLKEFCLHKIKSSTTKFLEHDTFLNVSPEAVNLIYSCDQLTIEKETELMQALEIYLEAHPETRTDLEDAIHNIRFLSMEEEEIMRCKFLDTETKKHLVMLQNNCQISNYDFTKFSKKKNTRSSYNLFSSLPTDIIVKILDIFNDKKCFICSGKHNSLACNEKSGEYKPFAHINAIYNRNSKSLFFETYSNDDIIDILKALRKVSLMEVEDDLFDEFYYSSFIKML